MRGMENQIIATCGKGGVGKTVFSALLARVLIDAGIKPLLLIDADPAGGLTGAIGERTTDTLAGVRDRLIESARKGEATHAADQLDYLLLMALVERPHYSLLAMGHSLEKGCFCPANTLLRASIDKLISSFAAVLIDVEAGIEQINRDVTRFVTKVVALFDGSQRSIETVRLIREMVLPIPISAVANRMQVTDCDWFPEDLEVVGVIPEDRILQQFDREGQALWELPPENLALIAVRNIAKALGFTTRMG